MILNISNKMNVKSKIIFLSYIAIIETRNDFLPARTEVIEDLLDFEKNNTSLDLYKLWLAYELKVIKDIFKGPIAVFGRQIQKGNSSRTIYAIVLTKPQLNEIFTFTNDFNKDKDSIFRVADNLVDYPDLNGKVLEIAIDRKTLS